MKLTYLAVLLTAFVAAGTTQAERRHLDEGIARACAAELEQLCKGQRGKEEQCLRSNSDKLRPDCKGALSKSKAPQPQPKS
jgi:hypothetical protein